jgi:hypothetical protein
MLADTNGINWCIYIMERLSRTELRIKEERKMIDITDTKGIPNGKLEHIFLGTVNKSNIPSGFHCDKTFGDERVYAEAHLYPRSNRIVTANRNQKLFEAYVRDKSTYAMKVGNNGKSTFFNQNWSRQDVVDCIARLKPNGRVLKEFASLKSGDRITVCVDRQTGMILVDNAASTYPLLKY